MGDDMSEIWKMDATAQAALVRDGDVSARELVELALARIDALDEELGSVVHLDREGALARADAVKSGPFAGVPFLAKDVLAVPGMRCAMGSRLFAQNVPAQRLPYVDALERAGLVTLGKTATSELGLLGSTETELEGATHNPWDLLRSAGGSSGGSAAAVAAGLVPMAHASDGGGSTRLPAALCGLFGFLPSRGRCVRAVPMENELSALVGDHCVSRSVRDSARLLEATADPDARLPPLGGALERPCEPCRIGVYTQSLMGGGAPAGGIAAVERAASLLQELGHEVFAVEAPRVDGAAISEGFFMTAGAAIAGLFEMLAGMGVPDPEGRVEPFTRALAEWFRGRPATAAEEAREHLAAAARAYHDFLGGVDVALCPTLGVSTPELGFLAPALDFEELLRRTERFAAYTPIHNIAGVPAMSVPLHAHAGLPVGVHFAAARGEDARLLALAAQLEEAAPWADRWPAFAGA